MINRRNIFLMLCCLMSMVLTIIEFSHIGLSVSATNKPVPMAELTNAPSTTLPPILTPTPKPLKDAPVLFSDVKYKELFDIDLGNKFIFELNNYIDILNEAVASTGYTDSAVSTMMQEIVRLQDILLQVQLDVNKYTIWESEYYYAAKVWEFFKQKGYSDVVVSAIIGNMMVEVGGRTLDLNPNLYYYSKSGKTKLYYGLCQWSLKYRPTVADMSFEDQLVYLHNDMEAEFKTFGKLYKKGFTYNDFLNMTDPSEASYAFAKVYERCASWSVKLRRPTAVKAYNYFTN